MLFHVPMLPAKTYKAITDALDVAIETIRSQKLTDKEDHRIYDDLLGLGERLCKRGGRAQESERKAKATKDKSAKV